MRMKSQMLSAVATLSVAVGAFAQGTIALNNFNNFPSCVDTDTTGNHYTGTFGIEVWALNAATVPAGINLIPVPGSGVAAYNAMVADGFTLEATFASQAMSGGLFDLGEVTLRTIRPPGRTCACRLGYIRPELGRDARRRQRKHPRRRYRLSEPRQQPLRGLRSVPAALTGWDRDLVMTAVPEPGTSALAGLGAGVLLDLRAATPPAAGQTMRRTST